MLRANSRILPIEEIKVPFAFERTTPHREKVDKAKQFYAVTGQFDHSILVDRNGYIFDGYARFTAAKEMGMDKVPVVQIVPLKGKKKVDKPAEDKPKFKVGDKVKIVKARLSHKEKNVGDVVTIQTVNPNGDLFDGEIHYGVGNAYVWFENELEPYATPSFDWDAFRSGKIAVHCDTKEKAKVFVQKCRENLSERATELWEKGETNWNEYKEDTCYISDSDETLCYSPESFFRRSRYTIIDYPFSEQPVKKPVMVTMKMLEKLGACDGGKEAFQRYFPDGGEFNAVWNKAMEISRRADADWLNNRREEIETMQDKQEPIKLYCTKDYGSYFSASKIYEFCDGSMSTNYEPLDRLGDGYDSLDHFFNKVQPHLKDCLFPLAKRPAKVGEWIYMEEDILSFVSDEGHLSEVVSVNGDGDIRNRRGYTMNTDHYLVLDGYQPEPEPEAEKEPEYYSGKVVCVETDGFFTAGKVYEFRNGLIKSDTGDSYNKGEPIKSLEELDDGTWMPKFIEYKGEADD